MKALVIFVFFLQTHPIYSEKFLTLIYRPKMFSSNQNQLVLVSHAQLGLDQSNYKILATPILNKSLSYSFFFHMDTNREELQIKVIFQVYVKAFSKT